MKSFLPSLLGCLLLSCTSEAPSDPDLPSQPCVEAADTLLGANGFVASGGGYHKASVRLASPSRSLGWDFDSIRTELTVRDSVTLQASTATVVVDVSFPAFREGEAAIGEGARDARLRIQIYRSNSSQIFRGVSGSMRLSNIDSNGVHVRGTYCGTLKDSLGGAQIAVMNGRFSSD